MLVVVGILVVGLVGGDPSDSDFGLVVAVLIGGVGVYLGFKYLPITFTGSHPLVFLIPFFTGYFIFIWRVFTAFFGFFKLIFQIVGSVVRRN